MSLKEWVCVCVVKVEAWNRQNNLWHERSRCGCCCSTESLHRKANVRNGKANHKEMNLALKLNEITFWRWCLSAFCITRPTRITGAHKNRHRNASRILFPYVLAIDKIRIGFENTNWPTISLLPTISFFTYTITIQPGAHHTIHTISCHISQYTT